MDDYLALLAKEKRFPALLDAGLAIEMKDLIERLISSENLAGQKLPYTFAEDVLQKNAFYTNVLLLGSNNSPSLEYNSITLTPEFREGYNYLLLTYPSSKAAQKLTGWLAIVKAKDKKKIEEMREAAYQ